MEITDRFRVSTPLEHTWNVLLDIERIAPCLPGAQLEEIEGDEYRGVVKVKVGPITAQYKGTARLAEVDEAARRILIDASGRDTRGQGNASAKILVTMNGDASGTEVSVHTDLSITGKVAQFGRGVLGDVSAKLLGQFVERLEADVLNGDAPAPVAPLSASPSEPPEAPPPPPAPERVDFFADPLSESASTPAPAAPPPVAAPPTPSSFDAPAPAASGAPVPAAPPEPVVAAASSGVRRIESPEAEPVDLLATAGAPVGRRIVPAVLGALLAFLFLRRRRKRRRRRG